MTPSWRKCLRCNDNTDGHTPGSPCPECACLTPTEDPLDHAQARTRRTLFRQGAAAFASVIGLVALLVWMVVSAN